MADSEVAAQEKTKEKKKKKVGSTKEKEPRKKSVVETDLQSHSKPPGDGEPLKTQQQEVEQSTDTAGPDNPTNSSGATAVPDSTKKSKKSKNAAKPDESNASDGRIEGRKASASEETTRKASIADGTSSSNAGESRKASVAPPTTEEKENNEAVDELSDEQPTKQELDELPTHIGGMYIPPPPATKNDIDLLQDIDENKLMELKEAFELFDYNQDGFIDYKDLKLTYQTLGYTDIADDYIANMLAEAMSPLDFDAFVVLLGYKTIEMDPEAVLVEALACWDYDNSGLISEDRIKHDLMTWGDKFSPEEADQALEDAPVYVNKKGTTVIDYVKFSSTLCGLRKKPNMGQNKS